jgi:hypothetical protein
MKYWLLALGCLAYGLLLLALSQLASPTAARLALYAAYAATAAAAFTTALSYAPGDRLRWAWLFFGGGFAIGFVSKLFLGDSSRAAELPLLGAALWSATIVLLNGVSLTALVIFARVWDGTGLVPPWRGRATLAFVALALLLEGVPLYNSARAMLGLSPVAFGFFVAVLGDVIGIALIGPIFATAIALRGGLLMRPWLFLFCAALCWLLDDATALLPRALALDADIVIRALAVLLGGAAAVAQLWVKREVMRGLGGS